MTFSLEAIHYETLHPVRIEVENGIISAVSELDKTGSSAPIFLVAPGLIDNQVNGYAGVDFSGEELRVEDILKATISMWKTGVTTYLPTLVTNTPHNLIRNFRVLADALSNATVQQSVPGFHLEGPWLSKLAGFRGCHREDQLSLPDLASMIAYQEAAKGKILQLTIAPELEGAMEMIRHCKSNGMVVAMGHSDAGSSLIRRACDEGLTLSTHLGNGCANMIHRHNNPIWPQLAYDQLIPTVIADGHHLTPEELMVFLKVKGAERLILTSDITYLSGMPAGRYHFAGAPVVLTEDGMLKSADQDLLAGASLPLLKGVENMNRFTGCTLGEAINMASGNVARVFGWVDRGALLPGRRADLVLLASEAGHLTVQKTFVAGNVVFEENLF
jgi:N-acetylglucosamine-6-phosphate deacetylase